MQKIKIYVRADLRTNSGKKVPNGKMAAQSAHALMAGFLALFNRDVDCLTSKKENMDLIKAFISGQVETQIIPIKEYEVEELLMKNVIPIIDQGRTVFREPTLTTIVEMPETAVLSKVADCEAETNERYRSKQTLVIDKSAIKNKWDMFEVVSQASLKGLLNYVIEMGDEFILPLQHEGLSAWINGAFAKITLQPKETSMIDLLDSLNNQSTMNYSLVSTEGGELACVAIGPHFIEEVDKFTKQGYSLV